MSNPELPRAAFALRPNQQAECRTFADQVIGVTRLGLEPIATITNRQNGQRPRTPAAHLQSPQWPNPRRYCIIQLHEDDEPDAPIGADDREQCAEPTERLGDDDAALDRARHALCSIMAHERARLA